MNVGVDEQKQIARWFDQTYRSKGDRYLRPLRAYYVFLELLRVSPGSRLLDVACGLGRLLEAGREYDALLSGVDISETAITEAQKRLPDASLCVANAEELPFDDRQFDYVTCLGSLERMLDRPKALREMLRVAGDDARFCLLVRNSETLSWQLLSGSRKQRRRRGHQDADSLQNWTELFESVGLEIIEVLPDQYPLHERRRWLGLGFTEVDYREPIRPRHVPARANEFVFVMRKRR